MLCCILWMWTKTKSIMILMFCSVSVSVFIMQIRICCIRVLSSIDKNWATWHNLTTSDKHLETAATVIMQHRGKLSKKTYFSVEMVPRIILPEILKKIENSAKYPGFQCLFRPFALQKNLFFVNSQQNLDWVRVSCLYRLLKMQTQSQQRINITHTNNNSSW